MTKQISIIDDNQTLSTSLALQFQSYGYTTISFNCPLRALNHHSQMPADAYIIDMKMPILTGFEFYSRLCENLKKDRIPALFLTAVHELEEKALKQTTIGDFVKKPFSFDVLIARLEKILSYFENKEKIKTYKIGNLQIIEDQILVKWYGQNIEMTKTEFEVIKYLTKRPRIVRSRNELLDICYGEEMTVVDRNIDSHIKRIRRKFRKANPKIKFDRIKTHYGIGYSWIPKSVNM